MIISIDTEKAFDNIQHLFMIKLLSKLGTEGNFPNLIKVINNKTSNWPLILEAENEYFPLTVKDVHFHQLYSLLY